MYGYSNFRVAIISCDLDVKFCIVEPQITYSPAVNKVFKKFWVERRTKRLILQHMHLQEQLLFFGGLTLITGMVCCDRGRRCCILLLPFPDIAEPRCCTVLPFSRCSRAKMHQRRYQPVLQHPPQDEFSAALS